MINRLKLRAIFLMSAVFALGAITGASWSTIAVSKKFPFAEISPGKGTVSMVEKFRSRLKLSVDQTEQLEIILHEAHQDFSELHQSVKPQFEGIRQKMRSSIRQMLSEEQKRGYEAMIREREQLRSTREGKLTL